MPAARRSSSDRVTIDSSPRRRLSQNADTESAPGNLPAMPTTAIALGGSEADCEKIRCHWSRSVSYLSPRRGTLPRCGTLLGSVTNIVRALGVVLLG